VESNVSWTVAGFSVLPSICVFAWLSINPKRDIIETHETSVRIASCVLFMLLFFLLLGVGSVGVFWCLAGETAWKVVGLMPLVLSRFE